MAAGVEREQDAEEFKGSPPEGGHDTTADGGQVRT